MEKDRACQAKDRVKNSGVHVHGERRVLSKVSYEKKSEEDGGRRTADDIDRITPKEWRRFTS